MGRLGLARTFAAAVSFLALAACGAYPDYDDDDSPASSTQPPVRRPQETGPPPGQAAPGQPAPCNIDECFDDPYPSPAEGLAELREEQHYMCTSADPGPLSYRAWLRENGLLGTDCADGYSTP